MDIRSDIKHFGLLSKRSYPSPPFSTLNFSYISQSERFNRFCYLLKIFSNIRRDRLRDKQRQTDKRADRMIKTDRQTDAV